MIPHFNQNGGACCPSSVLDWEWAQPLAHPAHQHVFERRHRASDDLGVLRHALGLRLLRSEDDSTKLELQFRLVPRAGQRELKS